MQEQIERESIAITLSASKLCAATLADTFAYVVKAQAPDRRAKIESLTATTINNAINTSFNPHTEKSLRELNKVCQAWNVDYCFLQEDKSHYTLIFKGKHDSIMGAFKEFSERYYRNAAEKETTQQAKSPPKCRTPACQKTPVSSLKEDRHQERYR